MTADTSDEIRPAAPADVPAVRAVTDAAYRHYIARIGVVPAPMRADHAADVAAGRVYVTGAPDAIGVLVLVPHEDHLFLESVAVHPDAAGESADGCSPSWTRTPAASAFPRSASTPTR